MSALSAQLQAYLAMRRALGYQLHGQEPLLAGLIAVVERRGESRVSIDAVLAWATDDGTAGRGQAARRLSMARRFITYLAAFDPDTEVPPANLLPGGTVRSTPYIFSPEQVQALIAAARQLSPALRAASMATFIALLAATGLRPGEALRLDRGDVDLTAGLLLVRSTKGGKTRLVPVHVTTVAALARYARRRDRLCRQPASPAFLLSASGERLDPTAVTATFRRLRDQLGITVPPGQRAARPHDLRHTFAVDTITGWHADGLDVQRRLPVLSTYLGHLNPTSTYWYCQAVPQLMSVVADRVQASRAVRP
jgi:integrase/recombinase XerD